MVGVSSFGAPLDVNVSRTDEVLVVLELSGVLDAESVPTLARAVSGRPPHAALVIDLRDVEFIDSSGIKILLDTHLAAERPPRWRFALVPGGPWVHRVFGVMGATSLLTWVDEPDEVLT